jgi:hypothetical protein
MNTYSLRPTVANPSRWAPLLCYVISWTSFSFLSFLKLVEILQKTSAGKKKGPRAIFPVELRNEIMKQFHDNIIPGHMGISQTVRRVKPIGMWPGIVKELPNYVKSRWPCKLTKPCDQTLSGPMVPRVSTRVIEHVAIDLVGSLCMTCRRHEYVLVMTDRW